MEELLTTKQVLDILQVDRTTIYRMLNDGRLSGVKVGQQWRFPHSEVEALLSGTPVPTEPVQPTRPTITRDALPISCLQSVQDVSAETMEVGAITTDFDGQPLTEISNSGRFCNKPVSTPGANWPTSMSRPHVLSLATPDSTTLAPASNWTTRHLPCLLPASFISWLPILMKSNSA